MPNVRDVVSTAIEAEDIKQLPTDFHHLLADGKNATVSEEECVLWDYKRDCIHSFTDDYFGSIVRLICALHNTYGGIIIFGVHDKKRTIGHNKVSLDVETLNSRLREIFETSVACNIRNFSDTEEGVGSGSGIDVLLIPKRKTMNPPVRPGRSLGKYPSEKLYIREGHEVRDARSDDLSFLYSSRNNPYLDTSEDQRHYEKIECSLPANPATMNSFVGRVNVIETLWHWLFNLDDSRRFLFGDGGSGKTTIAFEFAKLVIENGAGVKNYFDYPIDNVIFLTAKEKKLDTNSGQIIESSSEFDSAEDLFRQILFLCNFGSEEDFKDLDHDRLKLQLRELFDSANIFLIIDDIDTLMNKGIDPGAEDLNQILSRSKSGSKALFTNRANMGVVSRAAIEVPSLERETEYREFVTKCCDQFQQPLPDENIIFGDLEEAASRRPLVLEIIIGLARSCGGLANAIEHYKGVGGTQTRNYLFEREYNALAKKQSKWVLAALSIFDSPTTFEDLHRVIQVDEEETRSAIVEVRDMFLSLNNEFDDETRYELKEVAKGYIREVREQITHFETLKERIRYRRSGQLEHNRELEDIIEKAKLLEKESPRSAYNYLFETTFKPKIMERPDFRGFRGYIACKQSSPDFNIISDEMKYATDINAIETKWIREWFYTLEKKSEILDGAMNVCDIVIEGKGYKNGERAEFASRRGKLYWDLAQQTIGANPEKGLNYVWASVETNLRATNFAMRDPNCNFTDYLNRTSQVLVRYYSYCMDSESENKFFSNTRDLALSDSNCLVDPYFEGFSWLKPRLKIADTGPVRDMRQGKMRQILKDTKKGKFRFYDDRRKNDFLDLVEEIIEGLTRRN